jgi:hypothetical protein
MKRIIPGCLLVAATLAAGCVSQPRALVLDTVGPPDLRSAGVGSNGTLVVYSAFDSLADFNALPYSRRYSDYKITRVDSELLQTVHNTDGTLLQEPKRVLLPAGDYCVLARANGFGMVTVPVVIRADQVTAVHLEGSPAWQNRSPISQSNPVRLPDGEIVGWRANTPGIGQTSSRAQPRYHHEIISEFSDGETKFLQLVPDKNP